MVILIGIAAAEGSDAAVRLEAFLDAQDASDEDMHAARLQAHARHVRDHVGRLGSKAYWDALAT